jgi:hypothetical protein
MEVNDLFDPQKPPVKVICSSDHKSSSAGSIPVSPNRHGINQRKIIPLKEFDIQNFLVDTHERE